MQQIKVETWFCSHSTKTKNFRNNGRPLWKFALFYFDISLQAEEKRQTPSTEMCPAPPFFFVIRTRARTYIHVQTQKNYKGTAISKPMNLSSTPSTTWWIIFIEINRTYPLCVSVLPQRGGGANFKIKAPASCPNGWDPECNQIQPLEGAS